MYVFRDWAPMSHDSAVALLFASCLGYGGNLFALQLPMNITISNLITMHDLLYPIKNQLKGD